MRLAAALVISNAVHVPRRAHRHEGDLESGFREKKKQRTAYDERADTKAHRDGVRRNEEVRKDEDEKPAREAIEDVDDEDEGENDDDEDQEQDEGEPDGDSSHSRPSTVSRIRSWLSTVKKFILQSDVDVDAEERIPNYRWTPIVSGVIIPFSILLEIPGLTEHWYIRTGANNEIVETRKNTMILNVGLGISMACALVANLAVIVRFFEHRVKQMTIAAICALTIHGTSEFLSH